MTPDPSFVRDLTAYDAKLRVRWARHSGTWMIERKMAVRNPAWLAERPLNPFGTGKRKKDLWEGWKQGYVHVLSVHRNLLAWSIVAPALAQADSELAGSFEAIAARMEAADAAMEAERERTVSNWTEAAGKEGAERLMWLTGHRQAMPHEPSGITPSDTVTPHPDGFVVRVRKGAHGPS